VLCRGRSKSRTARAGDQGAIANGPHVGKALHVQLRRDADAPAVVWQRQPFEQRDGTKRAPCTPRSVSRCARPVPGRPCRERPFQACIQANIDPRLRKMFWAQSPNRSGNSRFQDPISRVDQDHAHLLRSNRPEVPRDLFHEIVDLGGHLHAGKSASGDDERKQRRAELPIGFNARLGEHLDEMVPQVHRIGQVLEIETRARAARADSESRSPFPGQTPGGRRPASCNCGRKPGRNVTVRFSRSTPSTSRMINWVRRNSRWMGLIVSRRPMFPK